MGFLINLFHIILVASLLCTLAKNLKDGNDNLKNITYGIVTIMVLTHGYFMYKKIVM